MGPNNQNSLGSYPSVPVEELFSPLVWTEPLEKFAKATGLTISLYDATLQRRCGTTTVSPIAARLASASFWGPGGEGARIDYDAAQLSTLQGKFIYTIQMELFAHLAVPLIIDGKVLATFIMGWLPENFADPVVCDAVSKKIGAPPIELWQLIRMQQPISREKLESHARMLETFAIPLIRQLMVQMEERRRAKLSLVISDTAHAFAAASSEGQLSMQLLKSICRLLENPHIHIEILRERDGVREKTHHTHHATPYDYGGTLWAKRSHVTFPIPTSNGQELGSIEVTVSQPSISDDTILDLQSLIGQFGVALHKVHLIHTLESERSALKAANLELQHLHKMKDEFLATVSHELRTPLNAILGWAQILTEGGPSMQEFELGMETIERNARNQSDLIEDLLDVSRIISGKMELNRDPIEATQILRESIETVRPMIEARRQKLFLQISSTPLRLKGDATRLTQVFWNLLSNASKFTPEGGDISVVLENAGHYFRLQVTDSGKGIEAGFLPNLFNRFSQADGSHTRRHGGLGLGLAIVRHLVELHGGTVSASSEGENKGATFTVFLPQNTTDQELDNAKTMAKLKSTTATAPDLYLSGVRVLLVDDEPDSLRIARFVLEKCGATVKMADSAEEGFQMLTSWLPDVLISDISMPEISGIDLIRRVRLLPASAGGNTAAIALTALAGQNHNEETLAAGFQIHLCKPLEPAKLVITVVDLLRDLKSKKETLAH